MTVGELLMALLRATTEGGVPEETEVVVKADGSFLLDSVFTSPPKRGTPASVLFVCARGGA